MPVSRCSLVREAGPLAVQLKQQITEVREEFKGPQFEPHVTLLGGIRQSQAQVLKTAKLLAASLTVRSHRLLTS